MQKKKNRALNFPGLDDGKFEIYRKIYVNLLLIDILHQNFIEQQL